MISGSMDFPWELERIRCPTEHVFHVFHVFWGIGMFSCFSHVFQGFCLKIMFLGYFAGAHSCFVLVWSIVVFTLLFIHPFMHIHSLIA